jgi:acetyltransferase-like isoleucine patch superfamily enzyme
MPSIESDGGQLRIGNRFRLASVPVPSHLAAGPGAILDIGNDVLIGHGAAIAAHQQIRIGNGTRIGPFVIIMDSNFHGSAGDHSVQHDCRPVMIGHGCRIGSRVTITRGVTIGDGAEVLAGSVVSSAVPGGVCVAGGRARIIGLAGALASRWESPATELPEILMASLGLDSPPDLDDSPMATNPSINARMPNMFKAIEARLGVALDPDAAHGIRTFADVAVAVLRAASERQRRNEVP